MTTTDIMLGFSALMFIAAIAQLTMYGIIDRWRSKYDNDLKSKGE